MHQQKKRGKPTPTTDEQAQADPLSVTDGGVSLSAFLCDVQDTNCAAEPHLSSIIQQ